MADLTQIHPTGPYQAAWNTTPIEEKPPECQIPDDPWPRETPTPLNPPTIPTDCTYKFPVLQIEPYFQTEIPDIPTSSGGLDIDSLTPVAALTNLKLGHATFTVGGVPTTGNFVLADAASAGGSHPFDILLTGGTSITLFPGTINQMVPSSMFTPVVYTPGTAVYVKIDVSTDGRKITAAAIVVDGSTTTAIGTTSGLAPVSFSVLLGVVNNGTVYQINRGNCVATIIQALVEDKAAPIAGQSPYLYWYTWGVAFA